MLARAAAPLAFAALALGLLTGCGGAAPAATDGPTVTAVGYAVASASGGADGSVLLHVNLLVGGSGAAAAWQTLQEATAAAERAVVAAGAPAAAVGVAGPPTLSAQVGPEAVEASQTVVASLPSPAAALRLLARLRTGSLAGYDGYYLTPATQALPGGASETAADRRALAAARARAARLAAAEGRRLGRLLASRSDILAALPCAPITGCASASGDVVPSPGPGQVVVGVTVTYATLPAR
ncbi:MAG: hypothetical protein K6V73_12555 [Firmicutes bacterium]|nr:hypothetical protein [Bacillota bacterium]